MKIYLILLKFVSITDDEINNCMKTKNGNEYAGKTDKTQTGSTCVNWMNTTDRSLAVTFPGKLVHIFHFASYHALHSSTTEKYYNISQKTI